MRMCSDDYGTVKPCIEGPPLLIVSVNTCTIDFDLCKETYRELLQVSDRDKPHPPIKSCHTLYEHHLIIIYNSSSIVYSVLS